MLLAFDDEADFARALAQASGRELAWIDAHRFPDGEWRLRLPASLPPDLVLLRSLHSPSDRLVQLLIASGTARELGARRLTLVAPYLCYMRQDTRFSPGEAVSQRLVGRQLAAMFERVITIDPHLHRVPVLRDAVPAIEAIAESAAPALGRFVAREVPDALLVGPDAESAQWVAAAANAAGLDWACCTKERLGDRSVRVRLPDRNLRARACVLVDDMVSTGHTIAQAAIGLHDAGCASVDAAVCHALLCEGAREAIASAGVDRLWSVDTIPDASNAVSAVPLIAPLIRP